MAKLKKFKALPKLVKAFVVMAALFFAIGLGTLGSFVPTGRSYELSKGTSVVFELEKQEGQKALQTIYLHISNAYIEPGETATVRFRRSTDPASDNWYSTYLGEARIGSFYTENENVKHVTGNWIEPYDLSAVGGYSISTYKYYELYASGCGVLVDEVVFLADNGTVIPAKICEVAGKVYNSAAEALIDAQFVPSMGQSSFFRFGDEERYTMATVQEILQGNSYTEGNVYTIDGVYNTLGLDLLAFGALIFGASPFGLRLFPFLACFGCLVVGYLLMRKLTRSDKAAFVYGLLFVFGGFPLAYGHLGTPLFLAIFFVLFALYEMYRFYSEGMKNPNIKSALPILFSGLSCACAVGVNGACVVPVLGVVALFVLGFVRQQKAKRYALEKAALADGEELTDGEPIGGMTEGREETPQASQTELTDSGEQSVGEAQTAPVRTISYTDAARAEYRYKNTAAVDLFIGSLLAGMIVISLLAFLPASYTFAKCYGHELNLFELMWKAFAGGFVGTNPTGQSPWSPAYVLFSGSGDVYATTVSLVNAAALVAAFAGILYAVIRSAIAFAGKESGKSVRQVYRSCLVPAVMCVLCLIAASFSPVPLFVAAATLFGFMAAGTTVGYLRESKATKAIQTIYIVLLAILFAVSIPFLFSVPLPAEWMAALMA